MTEPTAEEIREMCEWAGVNPWIGGCDDEGPTPWLSYLPWNDGRLLWAMHCKLREHGPVEYCDGSLLNACDDWYLGNDDAECLWIACREVRTPSAPRIAPGLRAGR